MALPTLSQMQRERTSRTIPPNAQERRLVALQVMLRCNMGGVNIFLTDEH
jgi:hypothetical protein